MGPAEIATILREDDWLGLDVGVGVDVVSGGLWVMWSL